jgi:GT2 family glycosyltransferase
LYQTLLSLYKSLDGVDNDVYVVDNNSNDNSVEYIKKHFPNVIIIENKENIGFSKANNHAYKLSNSKYILILNPDTVLKEDTIRTCLQVMESNPNVGAVGVKMIDGKGNYLPESKRGFPTPWASICKFSGLTHLFPKSKIFASYYLGHLSENETNKIEVLTGAFMFIRSNLYREVGMLDERYFMYGEDIDISYQITLNKFDILYISNTQIIHYKGEATPKKSLKFIQNFHDAMSVFYQKNFSKNQNKLAQYIILSIIEIKALYEKFKLLVPSFNNQKKKDLRSRKNWLIVYHSNHSKNEHISKLIAYLKNASQCENVELCEIKNIDVMLKKYKTVSSLNLVFDLETLTFSESIELMQKVNSLNINFWNALPNGTLLASQSKKESGEIYIWK